MSELEHLNRAKDALAQSDSAPGRWDLTVFAHRPRHARGGRSVLRAQRDDGTTLLLNVYDQPGQADLRFTTLTQLRAKTDRVVAPIFLDERRNLYAMQDAGQETLADRLDAGPGTFVTGAALGWLAGFADDAPKWSKPFDPGPIQADIERHLTGLHWRLTLKKRRGLATLRRAFAPFEGQKLIHRTIFGDLKPENLCIDPQTGVDYVVGRKQPLERDTAFLLQWMRQRNWRRLHRQGRPIDQTAEKANLTVARDVLGDAIDPTLLSAFDLVFLLQFWGELARKGDEPALLAATETRLGI